MINNHSKSIEAPDTDSFLVLNPDAQFHEKI